MSSSKRWEQSVAYVKKQQSPVPSATEAATGIIHTYPETDERIKKMIENRKAALSQKSQGTTGTVNLDDYANALKSSYKQSQALLDQGARTAAEEASVALDIAQKYLPVLNQMNGMRGLGVSESGALEAYNNYMQQLGAIEQTHASDSATLLENYRTALRDEQEKKQQEIKDQQDATYNELLTIINSGTFNTAEDLSTLVDQAKGKVNDQQWATLDYLRNHYKTNHEQKALETAQAEAAAAEAELKNSFKTNDSVKLKSNAGRKSMVSGDNFELQLGDTVYDVESRGEVTDESVIKVAKDIGNQKTFAYNGKIYFKQNGIVYEVGGRGGKNTSKDYTNLYNLFYGTQSKQAAKVPTLNPDDYEWKKTGNGSGNLDDFYKNNPV